MAVDTDVALDGTPITGWTVGRHALQALAEAGTGPLVVDIRDVLAPPNPPIRPYKPGAGSSHTLCWTA